jgi:hypothetical protein
MASSCKPLPEHVRLLADRDHPKVPDTGYTLPR